MNKSWLFCSVMFFTNLVVAQQYQQISCGAGYNKQSYVNLKLGTEKLVNNDAWDLAFTAFGFQDAGIFINESSGSSMGQNLPLTELYDAKTSDFSAAIIIDSIKANKYLNSEESWLYGAFNESRDKTNPYDFGWGTYLPSGQKVVGGKVYVLKLRNGNYKKIRIESLTGTSYTFKYANLDGSEEVTKTINKMPVQATKLIYFSFATGDIVDVVPAGGFDMMYGRYVSLARDPNGTIEQQYNVTGILTGPGVKVAVAQGVDPKVVSNKDYEDKYVTKTDAIGFDWKTLVGTSWSLVKDRAYFVKTVENRVWKIVLIDFEGSATGNAVFEKTDLGISALKELSDTNISVSPNPIADMLVVTLETNQTNTKYLSLEVLDLSGKQVYGNQWKNIQEFNVVEINTSDWKSGMYIVKISNDKHATSVSKVVKY